MLVCVSAVVAGCKIADHEPIVLLAGRAPPQAEDCGHAVGDEQALRDARACALRALAEGRPFIVASSPLTADGQQSVGWGSAYDGDGPPFLRLDYSMTIGFMFPGTDTEGWCWTGCASLESRGADCPSLADDLCLATCRRRR